MPDKVKEMTEKPNTLVIWGDDIKRTSQEQASAANSCHDKGDQ